MWNSKSAKRKVVCGTMIKNSLQLDFLVLEISKSARCAHSNARQLFEVAKTLIESGECDVDRTNLAVENLRKRITAFDTKMELRTRLIHLSVLFHIHYGEIMNGAEAIAQTGISST